MSLTLNSKIEALSVLEKTDLRLLLSSFYLDGQGLEVGALHHPLALPSKAKVKYVDRLPVEELRNHYPELMNENLVEVDIIDDGEQLHTIPDSSVDFIIANHMLEHCMNPIKTIQTFLSKLRTGGVVYIGIPDKRYSFDKNRELTSFAHLLDDYHNRNDHFQHYIEWAKFVNGVKEEDEIVRQAHHLSRMQYSIHFHVWDYNTFIDFLINTNNFLQRSFEILNISFNDHRDEVIAILRKNQHHL
jgi:predicted SAM-dependent methyltransferase